MTSLAAMTTPRVRRVGWDEFFRIFDQNDIAFLYGPEGDGRFSKFVEKESAGG